MRCWKCEKIVPNDDVCLGCGASASDAPPRRPVITSEQDDWEAVLGPKKELRYVEPEDEEVPGDADEMPIIAERLALTCPQCRSPQLTANKRGVSLKNAVIGGAVLGPAGLLGGLVGSSRVNITCLQCGHSWAAGQRR